jgi:hypothetical protein
MTEITESATRPRLDEPNAINTNVDFCPVIRLVYYSQPYGECPVKKNYPPDYCTKYIPHHRRYQIISRSVLKLQFCLKKTITSWIVSTWKVGKYCYDSWFGLVEIAQHLIDGFFVVTGNFLDKSIFKCRWRGSRQARWIVAKLELEPWIAQVSTYFYVGIGA